MGKKTKKYLEDFAKISIYSDLDLTDIQQWIDDDWESHDIERDAICLIQNLLNTIQSRNIIQNKKEQ